MLDGCGSLFLTSVFLRLWACSIFKACFGNYGSEALYFTRFGAPLEKCKSKEGFRSGGGACWLTRKHTYPRGFLRCLVNLRAKGLKTSTRFDFSVIEQRLCLGLLWVRASLFLTIILKCFRVLLFLNGFGVRFRGGFG